MEMIDLPQVMTKTTLGKSTIYAYVKEGKFPAPIKLGNRAIAWVEKEVSDWLDERVKASRVAS